MQARGDLTARACDETILFSSRLADSTHRLAQAEPQHQTVLSSSCLVFTRASTCRWHRLGSATSISDQASITCIRPVTKPCTAQRTPIPSMSDSALSTHAQKETCLPFVIHPPPTTKWHVVQLLNKQKQALGAAKCLARMRGV